MHVEYSKPIVDICLATACICYDGNCNTVWYDPKYVWSYVLMPYNWYVGPHTISNRFQWLSGEEI